MGELVLWGGTVRDRGPFIRVSPAVLNPSASPFPFGITSDVRGPEREEDKKVQGEIWIKSLQCESGSKNVKTSKDFL